MLTIWMDSWQLQCCGSAFSVGDQVFWNLVSSPDLDYPESVLGSDLAASITHREEHHEELDDARVTSGIVRSIRAVSCRYGTAPDGMTMYPISGSMSMREKQSADGWEPEGEDHRFVSYLIELDEAQGQV